MTDTARPTTSTGATDHGERVTLDGGQAPAPGHPVPETTRLGAGPAPAPAPGPPPGPSGLSQPQKADSSVRFTVVYTVPLFDVLANEVTLRLPFFEVNAQV